MEMTPLFELRERLRANVIAGAALAGDDFRLKRALDAFAPYEKAAPVFARIGALCRSLLAPDCSDRAGLLLEAISLADAVLCTQAGAEVKGELTPIGAGRAGETPVNAPYSVLRPLIDALTTSGGGKYSYVIDTHAEQPELFDDYRVRGALVEALGAGYSELADKAQDWLTRMGESVLPLLMSGFDPKGRRDMVRRVQTVEAIAGAEANDFYLKYLPDSEKDVRAALIYALRHDENNVERLVEIFKTEKGSAKKLAGYALARMDCQAADGFWLSSEKTKKQALQYAALSTSGAQSRIVAEAVGRCIEPFEKDPDAPLSKEAFEELQANLWLLYGKSGPEICQLYRRLADLGAALDNKPDPCPGRDDPKVLFKPTDIGTPGPLSQTIPRILRCSIICNPSPDLIDLALELRSSVDGWWTATGLAAAMLSMSAREVYDMAKTCMDYPKVYGVPRERVMAEALECACWDEELHRTCLRAALTDPSVPSGASNHIRFRRPLPEEPDRRLYKAMYDRYWGEDKLVNSIYWMTPLDDEEVCRMAGEYFYKIWKDKYNITQFHLKYLRRIGWRKCEGLAVKYVGQLRKNHMTLWSLLMFLNDLPGDREARQAEGRRAYELCEKMKLLPSGGLEALKKAIDELEDEPFTNMNAFM